jgi:protein subunit release factor A
MVDPFTAISITNGLLALCDRAIQCGKIVKKLHDLGATDEHKELEETADKMEIVVKELNSAQIMAKHQMFKTDLEVATVIGKMKTTCVNLREVLRECKAQKGSLRSAISATLRTMLKSSDITKFQKELEGYRTKLETLLLATIR